MSAYEIRLDAESVRQETRGEAASGLLTTEDAEFVSGLSDEEIGDALRTVVDDEVRTANSNACFNAIRVLLAKKQDA